MKNTFNRRHPFYWHLTFSASRSDCTDSFHHHDQFAPFHRIRPAQAVIDRQPKRTLFQTFHIQYHATVFNMEELHGGSTSVYEYEDIAQTDIMFHPVVNHSAQSYAQGTDLLSFINRQEVFFTHYSFYGLFIGIVT